LRARGEKEEKREGKWSDKAWIKFWSIVLINAGYEVLKSNGDAITTGFLTPTDSDNMLSLLLGGFIKSIVRFIPLINRQR